MVQINSDFRPGADRRKLLLGGLLLGLSMICVIMTIMFLYVSHAANQRVNQIRQDYREVAERRDAQVEQLSVQVSNLQHKLDLLPDRTASKTADKLKQVVKEDESANVGSGGK
ncbi:MAG: hypothetical protein QRY16_09685 [Enterobacterales bacterium endosymbiont of Blomia tropicalis]|uniref:hypothetical protein n=1 Tax=Mixta mediterraneensis TaxID=2758443 RepID=UPI0025A84EC8|nr:hypothetical protein [Mixta mediterraneensis]MDL4914037.1 hypothetical protein [Mixta mediterraneensis]